MNIKQFTNKLKEYVLLEIDLMSDNNPLISFMKPVFSRILDNNINKVEGAFGLIADTNGNIDAEELITEMIDSLISSKSFNVDIPILGKVNIGEGKIKLNLPFTGNQLMFTSDDLVAFKDMLKE